MDRKTLSNYGWIIIVTLIISIMLSLSTPFGKYIGISTQSFLETLQILNTKVSHKNTETAAISEMQPIATEITSSLKTYVKNPGVANYIYAKSDCAKTITEAFPIKNGITYVGTQKGVFWATGDTVKIYKNGYLLGTYYVVVLGDVSMYTETGTGDGVIDALDLMATDLIINGWRDPNGAFVMANDVNRDGLIDELDEKIITDIALDCSSGLVYTEIYNKVVDIKSPDDTINIFNEYETFLYSSIDTAMTDINNETIGINVISEQDDAGAVVFIDDYGKTNLILLKNTILEKSLPVNKSVVIDLGGKILTFKNVVVGVDIRNLENEPLDVKIKGTTESSAIESYNYTAVAVAARGEGITVDIVGGNYIVRSHATEIDENYCGPNGSKYQVRAFHTISATINASGVNIITSADNGNAYGIINNGILNVKNSIINADAKYSDDGTKYIFVSTGIQSYGPTHIENCNITGTHSGVSSYNSLYVNGGSYQSTGHGGIYVSGAGNTAYIQNAVLKVIEYNGQYDVKPETSNYSGFYVGGGTGEDNITVYVNGCEFYGTRAPFVLRGTSGEKNISVYISNSTINTDAKIRIDNDTHTLYLGIGNNFNKNNTTMPERVVVTNETYYKNP